MNNSEIYDEITDNILNSLYVTLQEIKPEIKTEDNKLHVSFFNEGTNKEKDLKIDKHLTLFVNNLGCIHRLEIDLNLPGSSLLSEGFQRNYIMYYFMLLQQIFNMSKNLTELDKNSVNVIKTIFLNFGKYVTSKNNLRNMYYELVDKKFVV